MRHPAWLMKVIWRAFWQVSMIVTLYEEFIFWLCRFTWPWDLIQLTLATVCGIWYQVICIRPLRLSNYSKAYWFRSFFISGFCHPWCFFLPLWPGLSSFREFLCSMPNLFAIATWVFLTLKNALIWGCWNLPWWRWLIFEFTLFTV